MAPGVARRGQIPESSVESQAGRSPGRWTGKGIGPGDSGVMSASPSSVRGQAEVPGEGWCAHRSVPQLLTSALDHAEKPPGGRMEAGHSNETASSEANGPSV